MEIDMCSLKKSMKKEVDWKTVKKVLAWRRQEKELTADGYRRHETDWEIHRGSKYDHVIIDAKISVCGKYVYTKLGKPAEIMKEFYDHGNGD